MLIGGKRIKILFKQNRRPVYIDDVDIRVSDENGIMYVHFQGERYEMHMELEELLNAIDTRGDEMNKVIVIGRLTKDIEMRYLSETQTAVARFTLAINRGKDKNSNDLGADYIRIIAFGKTAENCEKYLKKGLKVAVEGKIKTGKYEDKNGNMVYTTDIQADKVEFLEWGEKKKDLDGFVEAFDGTYVDEDIPF